MIRAKFKCISETTSAYGSEGAKHYKFQALYDSTLPEDQRFAKATPSGTLEILVDNPSAQFELAADYYLDFTKVKQQAGA
jgi:hypothetical protein